MTGADLHGENSGHEPNEPENSVFDAEILEGESCQFEALLQEDKHQFGVVDGALDESRVCLLDTGCTSCMHSKRWRIAYEKHLPSGMSCEETSQTKTFHFADGSSTSNRVSVWKIPVFLGGRRGEVLSAEIPTGSTPLLLSITAMDALDMILFVKDRRVQVRALKVDLPMLLARSKHRAVDITLDGEKIAAVGSDEDATPIIQSANSDLFIYLTEEALYGICDGQAPLVCEKSAFPACEKSKAEVALKVGPRGIHKGDVRKEMSLRRARELEKAAKILRTQDFRSSVALRRHFTYAEEAATHQFVKTVLFEPWGGCFGVTRYGSANYGWTNSQPLDLLDGYDLLSMKGQRLLWNTLEQHDPYLTLVAFDCRLWSLLQNLSSSQDGRMEMLEWARSTVGRRTLLLVVKICLHRHRRGRYYLIENPAGSLAWFFDELLPRLLDEAAGKYIISDQCAFGKIDADSGKPIKKPSGWLSNNEPLLNSIGKRCKCLWGSHQIVVGSNSFGARSKQAAAYPEGLCRAICQGLLHSMQLDYAVKVASELSYPALDDEEDYEPEPIEELEVEMNQRDFWEFVPGIGKIIRHHRFPRKALFSPMSVDDLPCDFRVLLPARKTFMKFEDGSDGQHEDEWTDPHDPFQRGHLSWTGKTEISIREPEAEEIEDEVPEREAKRLRHNAGEVSEQQLVPLDSEEAVPMTPMPATPNPATPGGTLKRRRTRTRQLQRGFWMQVRSPELEDLMSKTSDWLQDRGGVDWQLVPLGEELGQDWLAFESANAEIQVVLASANAKKLRKAQPFASPAEAPLRKSNLLLRNKTCLSTAWEEWHQLAPASQVRPLVAADRQLCVILFGKPLGEDVQGDPADPRATERERLREERWNSLPRELKLALRRVHVNLGHATVPQMLKAMRVSRASEVAIRACRLFKCKDCPRVQEPKRPRPSKLPLTEEFNVHIGLDVFQARDADGHGWSWLSILCQGTTFQVCILLADTHANPTSSAVLESFELGWTSWAGFPEVGIFTDRAKYFLADFADALSSEGCYFDSAAKASPWQIGQVERHGSIWKSILQKMIWGEQLAGREHMLFATSAINQAKNSLVRKSGFSPTQWVLGRSIRLPSDLTDDSEAVRLGALALSVTPQSRFYLKSKLRFVAREAFVQVSNSEALKRAELRKVRPSRGPFPVGSYVFYFDASTSDVPGPACWRGVARVIGHEGSHTVWVSH